MKILDGYGKYAHWVLRVAIAAVFVYHGIDKLLHSADISAMMGMASGMIIMLGLVELSAGVLAILGAFMQDWMTRVSGLIIIPIMLGAIALVHWPNWSFMNNGMEFQFTLIMIGIYFAIRGNSIGRA